MCFTHLANVSNCVFIKYHSWTTAIDHTTFIMLCWLIVPVCLCTCVCQLLSCVWLFATPWTIAHQASLFMALSRQEYWNGLPFPSPRDLLHPGIKPVSCIFGQFFTIWATREAWISAMPQTKRFSSLKMK